MHACYGACPVAEVISADQQTAMGFKPDLTLSHYEVKTPAGVHCVCIPLACDPPRTPHPHPCVYIYGTPTHKHITLILLVNHIPNNWLIVDILGCVYNIKRMYFVLYAKILPRWVPGHWFKGVRHAEPDLKIFNSSTHRNNFTRELSNGFIILGTDKSLDPG